MKKPLDPRDDPARTGREPEPGSEPVPPVPPADEPPTAAQLRHEIDRGAGADKVSYPDPAAAPLGTDDEAAGTPPTPEQLGTAAGEERRVLPEPPRRSDPLNPTRKNWLIWAAGAVIVLLLLIGLFD